MNREDSLLACLYELSEDSFTKDILVYLASINLAGSASIIVAG